MAAVGGRRRPVTTAVAPQGGRWSAPARSEALLAVVRATLAVTEAVVALALDGTGTGMASLLLLPVAVSMASLVVLRMAHERRGDASGLRRLGAAAMAADLVFLVASAALIGPGALAEPGALAAGWLTRTFVLLEGPVRYGVAGVAVTALPAIAVALAWPFEAPAVAADIILVLVPVVLAGVVFQVLRREATRTRIALARFEQAFTHGPIGLAVLDLEGRVLQASPSLAQLLGTQVDQIQRGDFAALLEPTMRDAFSGAMDGLLAEGGSDGWYGELALRGSDGAVTWALVGLSLSVDPAEGATRQVVAQVADLSDQRATQQALQHEATHDRLTGLPGREPFVQRLSAALESWESAADDDGVIAVLFCDLDGFKTVNDRYGHARGDQLLAITARRLAGALRLPTLAARWGGDEFVVLCDGVASLEEVTAIATRLIASVSQPIADEDLSARISMSVGIAVPARGERDPYRVIDAADAAMYRAKRLGAGGWVVNDTGETVDVPVH